MDLVFQNGILYFAKLFFQFIQILPYFAIIFGVVYIIRLLFKLNK